MGQRWIEMSTTADLHEVWSACHKYASSSGSKCIVIHRKKTCTIALIRRRLVQVPNSWRVNPPAKKPASQSFFNAALDLARAFGQRADSRSDPASTILRWIRMDGLGVWGCVESTILRWVVWLSVQGPRKALVTHMIADTLIAITCITCVLCIVISLVLCAYIYI